MARHPGRMLTVRWAHWPIVAAGATRDVAIVLRANRVVACSPAASADGVAIGQRRRIAQQRCPGAVLLDDDADRDARVFEPIVRAIGQFTPRLEMVEPGWLCIESRGPSRYFGGDEPLAAQIVDVIAATAGADVDRDIDLAGLGVGIADGRFASAVAAAKAGLCLDGRAQGAGILTRTTSRAMIVAPGSSRAFLAPQPTSWLQQTGETDAELVGLFARLGLTTLGALADLARADLGDRFGPSGVHAHRLACADDDRPSRAKEPPAERIVERVLDDPVVQLEPLFFIAKQLADRLVADLAMVGLVCTRLVVTSETEYGECSERVWYRASGLSAAAIVERVRWQLDAWVRGDPGSAWVLGQPGGLSSGVVLLRLNPDELRHDDGDQLRLWGGMSAVDERAVRAVARLAGMAGEQAVLVPAWQGGRLPSDRYRWVPATTTDLTDPDDTAQRLRPRLDAQLPGRQLGRLARRQSRRAASSTAAPQKQAWPGSLPAPSPSIVLIDGSQAVVADQHGQTVSVGGRGELTAPPATLTIGGRAVQDITGWAGPWPVDEWWWDERRHRRLARFQIVTVDGAAHLVAVERQQWWVLASYG